MSVDSGKLQGLEASLRPEGLLITALKTGVLEIRDPELILRALAENYGIISPAPGDKSLLDQT